MTEHDYRAILGFTDQWFSLGVMTDAILQEHIVVYESSDDQNSEHYRYGAFRRYLREHRPLSADMVDALYELGEADPDGAMGGSMMADILYLRECPESIFEKAAASDRKHLIKIVERRRLFAEMQQDTIPTELFNRSMAFRDGLVQQHLVETPGLSAEQLQMLAEQGANKKIRHLASNELKHRSKAALCDALEKVNDGS